MHPRIILASQSPRRSSLLSALNIPFEQIATETVEVSSGYSEPAQIALINARLKVDALREKHCDNIIIGADTIVVCDKKILGKPADKSEAMAMLQSLSGRSHRVITGLSIFEPISKTQKSDFAMTKVIFRKLSLPEIEAYCNTREPYDKAGAYAIQGKAAIFISRIEGCHSNVIGLPLSLLAEMLGDCGITISAFWK